MSNKLLKYKDVSERWQVPESTLKIWVMQGDLKPIKLNSMVRFTEKYISDIEENRRLKWDKK